MLHAVKPNAAGKGNSVLHSGYGEAVRCKPTCGTARQTMNEPKLGASNPGKKSAKARYARAQNDSGTTTSLL